MVGASEPVLAEEWGLVLAEGLGLASDEAWERESGKALGLALAAGLELVLVAVSEPTLAVGWGLASAVGSAQTSVGVWELASAPVSERETARRLVQEWGLASAAALAQMLVEAWEPAWAAALERASAEAWELPSAPA